MPSGHGEKFKITIDKLPKSTTNYYQESLLAAQEIEANKTGQLFLMYSGGVDSEYALSCFLDQGINIRPVIIRLQPMYNVHDIDHAFNFCSAKELDPLVINVNFDNFVKSGQLLKTSVDIKSSIFHLAVTAHTIGQLNGTVICGDGEPYICKNEDTSKWEIKIFEYDFALANFYKDNSIVGTPHFNRYTPQMMRSFLEDPRMIELSQNAVTGKLGSHSSKFLIYNRHSNFGLAERPKYHGYENIEKSEIMQHDSFKEIEQLGKQWDGVWTADYTTFMNQL